MIRALKMTALRMAECGLSRPMTLRRSRAGNTPWNMAGMMAKYLATSLAMENVVSEPRVMSSCLPISTISMSLVGLESRSTMFPASLAAWVPVFMATPTSAWARAGASLVPSPVMATRNPPACSLLMRAILSSGVASARKSSTPGLLGDGGGGQRVVAGDHHRADAHPPQLFEAGGDALLDHVLEVDDARGPRRRRPPPAGSRRRRRSGPRWGRARVGRCRPGPATHRFTESVAPLRIERPPKSTPLMRVWAVKGTSVAPNRSRSRRLNRSLASTTIERPSGVSSARLESWAASARACSVTPGQGEELGRLAVAEGDGARSCRAGGCCSRRPPPPPAPTWPARCAAPAGPCRRCRWRTGGPRWWWG